MIATMLTACNAPTNKEVADDFKYADEQFADLQMLRYKVQGFEDLTLKQKELVYYLSEAALEGRDILFDQNGKYNLTIRKMLETVYTDFKGDKTDDNFKGMETYLKRVWFSNGIHHHYGSEKFVPAFTPDFFRAALKTVDATKLPLAEGQTVDQLCDEIFPIIFDPAIMPKRVNQADGEDLLLTSECNYYAGVTQKEAEEFYAKKKESGCDDVTILVYQPVSGERIATASLRTYRYSNIYPFGQHDRCYDPSYRARLLAAKKINYLYEKYDKYEKMPDRSSYSVLDQLWRGKSFMERASSMYSANTIYMKLRSVGLSAASTSEELKKHVDVLAEVEHNRWDIERLILGVSDMTDSQRAQADADPGLYKNHWKTKLLMNKNIIPYDELDEGTKDYDKIIVRNMIDVVKE